MRGTLHVTTNLELATSGAPSRFVVRATLEGGNGVERALGQRRANVVAHAFEDALNATNLAVVGDYMRNHEAGNLDVVVAARILDAAGVRP